MDIKKTTELKIKLIPYILFPMMIGVLSGLVIFLFKIAASHVMHFSQRIYSFVRENPAYLPLLILGAALIGVLAALILRFAKACRGGGIPVAVASIRGLIPLKWVQGIFVLFFSSLLTFFTGVPLGNEGPSGQMGAAVGEGSSCLSGKNKVAWERYLMTGGACSGFAIATGAPLSGIMFALEEAHRRFSTTLFAVASVSVLTGTVTQKLLTHFFKVDTIDFEMIASEILPLKSLWAALIIGGLAGICSILFARLYRTVKTTAKTKATTVPFTAKLAILFAVTAFLGFLSANFIGTGHSLIDTILHGKTIWYTLLIVFVVRAILMICASNAGVSGGIFVPSLTFGAMIASLVAEALIALGLIGEQYYAILIVVGMASFLSASSRTPITAITFAAEALCFASNLFPVICGAVVSYIVAEVSGKISLADAVIEAHAEAAHRGKEPVIVSSHLTVQKGAFADGMEIRDILWPPTCAVLSIDKKLSHALHHSAHEVREGDVLHLHYQTYDPEKTMEMLTAILGEQSADHRITTHSGSEDHLVPLD